MPQIDAKLQKEFGGNYLLQPVTTINQVTIVIQ